MHAPKLTPILHAMVLRSPTGIGAQTISDLVGKPYQTLMSELSGQHGHKVGADLVLSLMIAAGSDAPMHFLAREMGGVFIRLPGGAGAEHPLTEQVLRSVKEFGDLMSQCAEALADGRITGEERDRITREGHEVLTAVVTLLQVVGQTGGRP